MKRQNSLPVIKSHSNPILNGVLPVRINPHSGPTQSGVLPVRINPHSGPTQSGVLPVRISPHSGSTQSGVLPVRISPHSGSTQSGVLPKLKVIQTSDPTVYKPLLDITSELNEARCKKLGIAYEKYCGIKRGDCPMFANFNRIYLLLEHLDKEFDWILYMDADAMITNPLFNPYSVILPDKDKGFIFCTGGKYPKWDVNDGVFFCNLRHPEVRKVLLQWKNDFESAQEVCQVNSWAEYHKGHGCQWYLQQILKKYYNKSNYNWWKTYMKPNHKVFNYDGPNIKQILRPPSGEFNLENRIKVASEYMKVYGSL